MTDDKVAVLGLGKHREFAERQVKSIFRNLHHGEHWCVSLLPEVDPQVYLECRPNLKMETIKYKTEDLVTTEFRSAKMEPIKVLLPKWCNPNSLLISKSKTYRQDEVRALNFAAFDTLSALQDGLCDIVQSEYGGILITVTGTDIRAEPACRMPLDEPVAALCRDMPRGQQERTGTADGPLFWAIIGFAEDYRGGPRYMKMSTPGYTAMVAPIAFVRLGGADEKWKKRMEAFRG